jgi:hypothetical protein
MYLNLGTPSLPRRTITSTNSTPTSAIQLQFSNSSTRSSGVPDNTISASSNTWRMQTYPAPAQYVLYMEQHPACLLACTACVVLAQLSECDELSNELGQRRSRAEELHSANTALEKKNSELIQRCVSVGIILLRDMSLISSFRFNREIETCKTSLSICVLDSNTQKERKTDKETDTKKIKKKIKETKKKREAL